MIVCINYSALYRLMYSYDTDVQMISSHYLVVIFLNCRCREQLLTTHFRSSPEGCLTEGRQVLSLCNCMLNQHSSLLVMLILGGFSFNSVMIIFSSALLLFFMVVDFVMSAEIIFLWHTYHLHTHKALKVLIIFS